MNNDMKKCLTIFFSALEQERLLGMLYFENPTKDVMRRYMEAKEATARSRLMWQQQFGNTKG